jgi:predicted SAM-dependent methyltransferase
MRIHVGCGPVYKKGYVNIDVFDSTVADRIMSAYHLEFPDDSASLVECMHTIEHLGAAKSIYALAEFFRVLKPGGVLLLETPDIEATFTNFLKHGEKQRKLLMNWIYGLDSPGMGHRYCFPQELLSRMLKETGFKDIQLKRFATKSIQPTLQVKCRKPESYVAHQIVSRVRRSLVDNGIIDLNDQVSALDRETLIQSLSSLTHQLCAKWDELALREMTIESAVQNPRMGLIFNEQLESQVSESPSRVKRYGRILETLGSLDFPAVLLHLFMQVPLQVGTQNQTYLTIRNMGVATVKKLLTGTEEQAVLKELRRTRAGLSDDKILSHFSEEEVKRLAEQSFAHGAKYFATHELTEAVRLFEEAFSLNRDNLLITWNLARLKAVEGNGDTSRKYYEMASSLAQRYKQPFRRRMLERLRSEIRLVSEGQMDGLAAPVYQAL